MNHTFEFCLFTTGFADRAHASGGQLFGCWRTIIGLGLARDEGIALTA